MSRETLWELVLQEFKTQEVDEALTFVLEDGWLRRAIAAWAVLPGIRTPDRFKRTALDWGALWEGVDFSLELYAQHLDTYEGHARQLFDRARALMLIYPDGSLHEKAQRILRERVAAAVEKKEEEEGED